MSAFLINGVRASQIYLINSGETGTTGYLISGERPWLIYRQIDVFKCLGMPLTSQKLDALSHLELFVRAGNNGLWTDSKVMVDQFQNISVDRIKPEKYLGNLEREYFREVSNLFRQMNL